MIIWQGMGLIVPVVIATAWFLFPWLLKAVVTTEVWSRHYVYLVYVSLGVAALVLWFVGRNLNRKVLRTYIDESSGRSRNITALHSFLFIKIHYWALLLVGFVAALEFGSGKIDWIKVDWIKPVF